MNVGEFSNAPKLARNPLGIIALFIVLVDGIAGFVLGVSSRSLQPNEKLPLIYFLVFFPVVVLGVFYRLVAKHHEKFYAPGDFPDKEGFFRARESADIMFRFNEFLAPYSELKSAIESNKPILKANDGTFSEAHLQGYLDELEWLNDLYVKRLISKDMLYSSYSY